MSCSETPCHLPTPTNKYSSRLLRPPQFKSAKQTLRSQPTLISTFIHTCIRIIHPSSCHPLSLSLDPQNHPGDVQTLQPDSTVRYIDFPRQHPSALFPRQRRSLRSHPPFCLAFLRPRGNGGAVLTALRCNCGGFKKQERAAIDRIFWSLICTTTSVSDSAPTPRCAPRIDRDTPALPPVLIFGRWASVLGSGKDWFLPFERWLSTKAKAENQIRLLQKFTY